MTYPVPVFAQEAYAILRGRFGEDPFGPDHLAWFVSRAMVKKTLHVLEQAGWIERVGKGRYVCVRPEEVFEAMLRFRVPDLLASAGRPYAHADASAVEIWTDYTFIQRSWEHSPYFVKVLRRDMDFWVDRLRKTKVRVFIGEAEPALGEFVVMKPVARLAKQEHAGLPVEPLSAVVAFCERHIDNFEFPLAYLQAKYGIETNSRLDPRVVAEARAAA